MREELLTDNQKENAIRLKFELNWNNTSIGNKYGVSKNVVQYFFSEYMRDLYLNKQKPINVYVPIVLDNVKFEKPFNITKIMQDYNSNLSITDVYFDKTDLGKLVLRNKLNDNIINLKQL